MYALGMKNKSPAYPPPSGQAHELKEYAGGPFGEGAEKSMLRTQVYLTQAEHQFLRREAFRRGEPMSAYLRRIIDEKMAIPADAWTNNPMLEPTPDDAIEGPEDGALNHDYYAYGGSKKYKKVRGQWVMKAEDEP
jgi:hypothetical protein